MADQPQAPAPKSPPAAGSALDAVQAGPATEPALPARLAATDLHHPTVDALRARFGTAIVHHEVTAGNQHVVYVEPARNREILGWLKEDPSQHYDFLADVTGVDYGGGRPLQVVYQLWSMPHRRALRVKCELPVTALEIDSVQPLWATADWLEREVYDLFGIEFRGHPDLRRILMPENYAEGHPLRKDFPLRGRFTRAEQTRRALSQDPHDQYIPAELAMGREPQMPATPLRGNVAPGGKA
jgi:NADH-quinone oxidoreductase subunit C